MPKNIQVLKPKMAPGSRTAQGGGDLVRMLIAPDGWGRDMVGNNVSLQGTARAVERGCD